MQPGEEFVVGLPDAPISRFAHFDAPWEIIRYDDQTELNVPTERVQVRRIHPVPGEPTEPPTFKKELMNTDYLKDWDAEAEAAKTAFLELLYQESGRTNGLSPACTRSGSKRSRWPEEVGQIRHPRFAGSGATSSSGKAHRSATSSGKRTARAPTNKKDALKYIGWPKSTPTGQAIRDWFDQFNDETVEAKPLDEFHLQIQQEGFGPEAHADESDPVANTKMVV